MFPSNMSFEVNWHCMAQNESTRRDTSCPVLDDDIRFVSTRVGTMTDEATKKYLAEREQAHLSFPFITIHQVAEHYGVSLRTLRRLQAADKMPPRKKWGRHLVYLKTDIAGMFVARGAVERDNQ